MNEMRKLMEAVKPLFEDNLDDWRDEYFAIKAKDFTDLDEFLLWIDDESPGERPEATEAWWAVHGNTAVGQKYKKKLELKKQNKDEKYY